MALPNTGIGTALIGEELGVSTRDVGELCTSTAINMWSKWKPVRYNTNEGLTLAQLQAVNYGLGWSNYANINAVKAAYGLNESVVFHSKPRGSEFFEPFREGDFRGYEHLAISPIAAGSVTSQAQATEGGQTTLAGTLVINGNPKAGEIGLADLGMDNRKLALALYDGNTLVKTAIAANPGDAVVEMDTRYPLPVLQEKEYKGYLFFTNNAGTTASSLRGIPNHPSGGFTVTIVGQQVSIGIEASWGNISNPNTISYLVSGTNETGGPVSLLNCSIRFRNNANACTSTMQQYEQLISLGNLTLPPTEGTFMANIASGDMVVERSQFSQWKLCWNNGGAYPYTLQANIIERM